MHDFMGFSLVEFSMFKFFNIEGFADGFQMYDLLAKPLRPYAYLYPFMELGLGLGIPRTVAADGDLRRHKYHHVVWLSRSSERVSQRSRCQLRLHGYGPEGTAFHSRTDRGSRMAGMAAAMLFFAR
jgi:hypothetical protein